MLTDKQEGSFGDSAHSLHCMCISSAMVGVFVCVCLGVCVCVSMWESKRERKRGVKYVWSVKIMKCIFGKYGLHLVVDVECFLATNSNSPQKSLMVSCC